MMKLSYLHNVILLNIIFIVTCSQSSLRGLNPYNKDHYTLKNEFRCLDGSKSIPFEQLNDDYCDCSDGSDEPGTSACPNGVFYCMNEGYRPTILPSNRVADGVCDCCDGSDEYDGSVRCQNTCMELGQQLRADEERKYSMFVAGNEVYKQYCEEGSKAKQEHREKLLQLQGDKEGLEGEKEAQAQVVKKLEGPETEAKEKFKKEWEASRDQRKEERERGKAIELFHQLDLNSDGRVTLQELSHKQEFDTDGDGSVSIEESKEHMSGEGEESMEFVTFYETTWKRMEVSLKEKLQGKESGRPAEEAPPPYEEDDEEEKKLDEEDEEEDVDADNDDDDDDEGRQEEGVKEEEEEQMPPYDTDTQSFIDAAEAARTVLHDLESKLSALQKDLEHASKIVESDYGPENEFYSLSRQCIELSDREYLYKICPFDRTSQRNKHGGSETSLGYWTRWEDSTYKTMVFERGQGCWNGPDRSTKVSLECGPENKLLSAEEPSRCEYYFVLSTPAACNHLPSHHTTPRQEL